MRKTKNNLLYFSESLDLAAKHLPNQTVICKILEMFPENVYLTKTLRKSKTFINDLIIIFIVLGKCS